MNLQRLGRAYWSRVTVVAFLAGALYFSWPLGYLLNPSANRGLASNLEALHQPYNWLFILLDVASGLLTCIVAWWLRKALRKPSKLLLIAILGLAGFGILTAIDAGLPLDCVSTQQRCPDIFADPFFVIHGIASIGSVACLTISMFAVWWLLTHHKRTPWLIRLGLHLVVAAWLLFGVVTLLLLLNKRESAASQHVFIGLCSFWTACLPYCVWLSGRQARRQLQPSSVRVR